MAKFFAKPDCMDAGFLFAIVTLLLVLCGCSQSETQRAFGSVSLGGEVLESGQIEFAPIEGTTGPIAGSVIENGRYEVPAVTQGLRTGGKYKVSIISMKGGGEFAPDPNSPNGKREILVNVVPSRYNQASELNVQIEAGDNEHNFALEL